VLATGGARSVPPVPCLLQYQFFCCFFVVLAARCSPSHTPNRSGKPGQQLMIVKVCGERNGPPPTTHSDDDDDENNKCIKYTN